MPTLHDVIQYRNQAFRDSTALIAKKGHDYNRQQQDSGDTLFNLRLAQIMGVVPTAEHSVLVRLCDKIMRLASLIEAEPKVGDESIYDTILDVHNYIDYLGILRQERLDGKTESGDKTTGPPTPLASGAADVGDDGGPHTGRCGSGPDGPGSPGGDGVHPPPPFPSLLQRSII